MLRRRRKTKKEQAEKKKLVEVHQEIEQFKEPGLKENKPAAIAQSAPKVGRNDPCPCGSGKKSKKCCNK
ncbi:MAG TPA: SEC-C metal-binding domain-containing protein [Candidatus Paceibacterota bacterium]|nr:SEC-C metal-binding domain-containing protein [Candidatus Paceibacterota bacterium]